MGSSPIKGKIPMAQLVEQLSDKQEVTGSSPVGNSRVDSAISWRWWIKEKYIYSLALALYKEDITSSVSSIGRVLVFGTIGYRFDSYTGQSL